VRRGPPFSLTLYPLQYRFPADRLVQAFKFNRQLAAGRVLAELMCEHIRGRDILPPDALVPVPLHAWRLFQRGFNQSYELAVHIGRALGIPLQANGLRRRRNTRAQSGLDRKQRRRNVRGAFHWKSRRPPCHHVALVDDVMTTGTTVAECARVLKRAGARRVDVWLAARAMRST
jgi:ComF family protein